MQRAIASSTDILRVRQLSTRKWRKWKQNRPPDGRPAGDGSATPPMRAAQDWEASPPVIAVKSGTHK
jgi:hypothetical protein